MDSGIQMFTTDSVSTISSGKIVAQTSTFEQTSMTDDDPGIRIIGDNKVEIVYKNRITNENIEPSDCNSNPPHIFSLIPKPKKIPRDNNTPNSIIILPISSGICDSITSI